MDAKKALRQDMRARRDAHVAALDPATRALVLRRPPAPVAAMIPADAVIGFYHAVGSEAPAAGWARWFAEQGHRIALPWFAGKGAPMRFRHWANPWDDGGLVADPHGARQPDALAEELVPDAVIVPLLAFTAGGGRLGQGGGHYDRWLADHPDALAIGLGWDCQQVDSLPLEPHDRPLTAIVTPTRFHEASH